MDLITGLPKTQGGYDAIVVFVDKLTKMIHAIPTNTIVDAPTLANIFFKEIFRLHGLPKAIISDKDLRFTSIFWRSLFSKLGIELAMSTTFHP